MSDGKDDAEETDWEDLRRLVRDREAKFLDGPLVRAHASHPVLCPFLQQISTCSGRGRVNWGPKIIRVIPSDMQYAEAVISRLGVSPEFPFPLPRGHLGGGAPILLTAFRWQPNSDRSGTQSNKQSCESSSEGDQGAEQAHLVLDGRRVPLTFRCLDPCNNTLFLSLRLDTDREDSDGAKDYNCLFLILWLLRLESLEEQDVAAKDQFPFIWAMLPPIVMQCAQQWKAQCLTQLRIKRAIRTELQSGGLPTDLLPLVFSYASLIC
jgi:hypothetical protein